MTGTVALAWANVAPAAFSVTHGKPRRYQASQAGERAFCGTCGSPLFYAPSDRDAHVSVSVGCLDQPEGAAVQPRLHMFIGSRLCWFETADALPHFPDSRLPHPDRR